jgi:hypothetical protein
LQERKEKKKKEREERKLKESAEKEEKKNKRTSKRLSNVPGSISNASSSNNVRQRKISFLSSPFSVCSDNFSCSLAARYWTGQRAALRSL